MGIPSEAERRDGELCFFHSVPAQAQVGCIRRRDSDPKGRKPFRASKLEIRIGFYWTGRRGFAAGALLIHGAQRTQTTQILLFFRTTSIFNRASVSPTTTVAAYWRVWTSNSWMSFTSADRNVPGFQGHCSKERAVIATYCSNMQSRTSDVPLNYVFIKNHPNFWILGVYFLRSPSVQKPRLVPSCVKWRPIKLAPSCWRINVTDHRYNHTDTPVASWNTESDKQTSEKTVINKVIYKINGWSSFCLLQSLTGPADGHSVRGKQQLK